MADFDLNRFHLPKQEVAQQEAGKSAVAERVKLHYNSSFRFERLHPIPGKHDQDVDPIKTSEKVNNEMTINELEIRYKMTF